MLYNVKYSLNENGEVRLDFSAMVSSATPINLANHVYFNLGGHTSGAAGWFTLTLGGIPQGQQIGLSYSWRAYLRGSRLVYFILGGRTSGAAGWFILFF